MWKFELTTNNKIMVEVAERLTSAQVWALIKVANKAIMADIH
jgi:hypothetical protein